MKEYMFYAPCPAGLENLLCNELEDLGAKNVRPDGFGARFKGNAEIGIRACIWSRLAGRILLVLSKGDGFTPEALYRTVHGIDWAKQLIPGGTIAVHFSGRTPTIRNTQFGAVKVKDAIVDRLRKDTGKRPSVNRKDPDLLIDVRIRRREAWVSIDMAGDSLHLRGYRIEGGEAPLRETLAAGILRRCGWPITENGDSGIACVDPMCGSGTVLIEAAYISADIAPGLSRNKFGFMGWKGTPNELMKRILRDAETRKREGIRRVQKNKIRFLGCDKNPRILETAKRNATRAGIASLLDFEHLSLSRFQEKAQVMDLPERGIVVTNPPYGERLQPSSSKENDQEPWKKIKHLTPTYKALGELLAGPLAHYRAGVLIQNEDLGYKLGIRAKKRYSLKNGPIKISLLIFDPRHGDN